MSTPAHFSEARKSFHAALLGAVLRIDERGVASNADSRSQASIRIARGIVNLIGEEAAGARLAGQMSGRVFEEICQKFLENTFLRLGHLRPGIWRIRRGSEAVLRYTSNILISLRSIELQVAIRSWRRRWGVTISSNRMSSLHERLRRMR